MKSVAAVACALGALALLVPGGIAAAAPPAAKTTPAEDPEVRMGREAHEDLLKSGIKFIRDPKILERVERIGKKIAAVANENPVPATYGSEKVARYEYQFFVVDDKDVNAFSLPGGFIYINKGLLDYVQSDDELAGVLGHEIVHAAHHHVAKLQREQHRLGNQLAIGLLAAILARVPTEDTYNLMTGLQLLAIQRVNGHGQNAERDADHGGVIVAHKAGYNPVGALTFMERLARDERARPEIELGVFRTHPPSPERADAMIAQIKGMDLPLNRRAVTNAIKAESRPSKEFEAREATELVLDGKVIFRSVSANRIARAAELINRLLDEDLQIYDVKQDGAAVRARGQTLFVVQPDDAVLSAQPTTPEAVADQAVKVLRNVLFKQSLEGV